MAATQIDYGVAHFYGLRGTRIYMTVQSDSISDSFKLDVEVADEVGRVITDRLDDEYFEITLDGVLLASDLIPSNGSQMTYAGRQYITKSIEDKGTNKDFRKVSVKAVKYQEIA
tara:strand:+ start:530 stop:871 length:342 start_codon:yes stop_codon:yes gene_type:complete